MNAIISRAVKMKGKTLLTALVLLSVMQGSAYAMTNGSSLLGKTYDEYKVFNSEDSSDCIYFLGKNKSGEITFNQGAEFNYSDTFTAIEMGDYSYPPEPENDGAHLKINLGDNSAFKVNGGDVGVNISYYSSLEIVGKNTDLNFTSQGNPGDQRAAVYVGNGASYFKVDGGSLTLDGGYDSALSATHSSSVDIELTGDLVAKNAGSGLAIQQSSFDDNEWDYRSAYMHVNADNIYLSTSDDQSVDGEDDQVLAGLFVSNYNREVNALDVDIIAKNNLSSAGYQYGLRSEGKADIYLQGNEVEFKTSGNNIGTGIYLNSQSNYFDGMDKGPTIDVHGNMIDIYGGKYGIRSAREGILNLESTGSINIRSSADSAVQGNHSFQMYVNSDIFTTDSEKGYGIELTDESNAELSADYITVSGGGSLDAFNINNSNVTLKTVQGTINNRVAVEDGSVFKAQSLKGKTGFYSIEAINDDALYAVSDTDEKSVIDIETSAVISNQGENRDYIGSKDEYAVLHALRNSTMNINSEGKHYELYGDIIAGRGEESDAAGGEINIGGTGTVIKGDVIAGNTGNIEMNIQGGIVEGRIDDYADATLKGMVFRPKEFDVAVTEGGTVNMTLNNSIWTAHGQSFVTGIDFGQEGGLVDLSQDINNSVTIRNLKGNGTFNMLLNSEDHSVSDMLYIGKNEGVQTINIVGGITGGLENISADNPLRFATVGIDTVDDLPGVENSGISAYTRGAGLYNLEYLVDKEKYDKQDADNEKYNGSGDGQGVDKPGNDFVENALVENSQGQAVNWIITGAKKTDMSDSGRTIVNMSHANYKNAIYMDRLNKRLGEARYIDGDEGMWVRLRHDRIGMQDEFRSMNTMYQLGYDKLDDRNDKGERHIGAAIDYMDGSTSYSDIFGEGETKRWGFWLYETWLGNKGHYADYIVKYGHLDNDFDLTDRDSGEKVTGDYSNNVFSASAEYGRKKDIGNSWYVEPQVQMQYAYVTSADYTTSQGTRVELDGIDSLIGRAGFRLGRDVGEKSTVYLKADILHEFLGDQRITAGDATGSLDKTYENEGTWYDVGFGFAKAVGHNSYAYLDFETSFGNDNDETYQINAGMQWSF